MRFLFCVLLLSAASVRALDDGTWVKVGEMYAPAITGTAAAPVGFGSVSLLEPCYVVGPDGVGVVVGSTMSGTIRYVFAMRLDAKRLAAWAVLPATVQKWYLHPPGDDGFGEILQEMILDRIGNPLRVEVGYLLDDDINHQLAVATFIRSKGFASVAIAASGRSLWFLKWISDRLTVPPFVDADLPPALAGSLGFVNSVDWDGDGVLNITEIAQGTDPLTVPFVTADVGSAASPYTFTVQTAGAGTSTTVTSDNGFGAVAVWQNQPFMGCAFNRSSSGAYRYEFFADAACTVPMTAYGFIGYTTGNFTVDTALIPATGSVTFYSKAYLYPQTGGGFYVGNHALSFQPPAGAGYIARGPWSDHSFLTTPGVNVTVTPYVDAANIGLRFVSAGTGGDFGTGVSYTDSNVLTVGITPVGTWGVWTGERIDSTTPDVFHYRNIRVHVLPSGSDIVAQALVVPEMALMGTLAVGPEVPAPNEEFTETITCPGAVQFDINPMPPGLTLNRTTGVITWPEPVEGTYTLKIWAHDGHASKSIDWAFIVGGGDLAIVSASSATVVQGSYFQVLANKSAATFTVSALPFGVTYNSSNERIVLSSAAAVGTYTISITATLDAEEVVSVLTLTIVGPTPVPGAGGTYTNTGTGTFVPGPVTTTTTAGGGSGVPGGTTTTQTTTTTIGPGGEIVTGVVTTTVTGTGGGGTTTETTVEETETTPGAGAGGGSFTAASGSDFSRVGSFGVSWAALIPTQQRGHTFIFDVPWGVFGAEWQSFTLSTLPAPGSALDSLRLILRAFLIVAMTYRFFCAVWTTLRQY